MNRALAASLSLVAAIALAGCDGKSDAAQSSGPPSSTPSVAATTTPSATPSASPTLRPPTPPAAALGGLTVTAAESFARFYFQTLDYLTVTGDAASARRWADKSCIACKTLIGHYEAIYKAGGSVTGDAASQVVQVSQVRLIRHDTAAVLLKVREGKTVERTKRGGAPTTYPAGTLTWDLTLAAAGSHWTMFEMETK
ncbi:MAG TPA: DUF6318 family protein [Kribbellaceae bacterium]